MAAEQDKRIAEHVRGLKAGDEGTWSAFIEPQLKKLVWQAMGFGLSYDDANDAVQSAIVSVHNARMRLDENRDPTRLLYSTLKNRAIDRHRTNQRRRDTVPLSQVTDETVIPNGAAGVRQLSPVVPSAEDRALLDEQLSDIMNRIQSLPFAQRTALLLQAQGFTMEEIAERTNSPLGTVKTRIRLACMKLGIERDRRKIHPKTT